MIVILNILFKTFNLYQPLYKLLFFLSSFTHFSPLFIMDSPFIILMLLLSNIKLYNRNHPHTYVPCFHLLCQDFLCHHHHYFFLQVIHLCQLLQICLNATIAMHPTLSPWNIHQNFICSFIIFFLLCNFYLKSYCIPSQIILCNTLCYNCLLKLKLSTNEIHLF